MPIKNNWDFVEDSELRWPVRRCILGVAVACRGPVRFGRPAARVSVSTKEPQPSVGG